MRQHAHQVLTEHGWTKISDEQEALYWKRVDGNLLLLCLYVDDLLASGVGSILNIELEALRADMPSPGRPLA